MEHNEQTNGRKCLKAILYIVKHNKLTISHGPIGIAMNDCRPTVWSVGLQSGHDGNEEIGGCGQKIDFWPKNPLFGPKRATLGSRGQETARRAAKRPSTGKPKVSRVTSGYGGHVISPVRCV